MVASAEYFENAVRGERAKVYRMPENSVYWYVLRVRYGTEERVVESLKEKLDKHSFRPFIPQKTHTFRRKGEVSYFQKKCFPCYIFVESDKPEGEFIRDVFPVVYRMKDTRKFLSYDAVDVEDEGEGEEGCIYEEIANRSIALHEADRLVLNSFLGEDRCIGVSKICKDGDIVSIVSGPLMGFESKILKISKKNKEAIVAVEMHGKTVPVSVALEFVENK